MGNTNTTLSETPDQSSERSGFAATVDGLETWQLDAEVAERIMGYVINGSHWPGPGFWLTDRPYGQFGHGNRGDGPRVMGSLHDSKNKDGDKPNLWSPTAQIQTAMEVVEKVLGTSGTMRILIDGDSRGWEVDFKQLTGDGWIFVARNESKSLPEAICRAALTIVSKPVTKTA